MSGSRPQDMRQSNCRAILNLLTDSKNMTINELAEAMNLSRTAVQNILTILLQAGMITADSKRSSTIAGGKKALSYSINPTHKYCICLHMTSEYVSAEAYNFSLSKTTFYFASAVGMSYVDIVKLAARAVINIMTEVGLTVNRLFGIVISVSGMVNSARGILVQPTGSDISGKWGTNLHIVDDLRAELGIESDIRISVDNLCNFSALSMLKNEKYSKARSYLYIMAHNRGIGAALIKGGEIVKGDHGLMGEIGHTTIAYTSKTRCRCGRLGCFESMLYTSTITERVNEALASGVSSCLKAGSEISITDLFIAADNGDEYAREQTRIIAAQFAHLLYNTQIMCDPEIIVFHDSYLYISSYFHQSICEALDDIAGGGVGLKPTIYFDASDFNNSVRLGAAVYCLEQYLAATEVFA